MEQIKFAHDNEGLSFIVAVFNRAFGTYRMISQHAFESEARTAAANEPHATILRVEVETITGAGGGM